MSDGPLEAASLRASTRSYRLDSRAVDGSRRIDPQARSPVLLLGHLLLDPTRPPTRGWLVVADGRIVDMGHADQGNERPPERAGLDGPTLGDANTLIVPGFIDAHMHLPQIECVGCDGLELLPWLDTVIFPAEASWHDPIVVARHVDLAIARMRRGGTVGAAAFASPVAAAMDHAVARAVTSGFRLAVGQALMDRAGPPSLTTEPIWRPPPLASLPRAVEISVNPRFALSCSDALLDAAAQLAQSLAQPLDQSRQGSQAAPLIQTHLAETHAECAAVARLFPDDASYTAVYDRHGLLGPRTLLAHALHLGADEWATIAARDCTVVHCPQANLFLRSGLFDLGAARTHAVRVALGSDIAAGCDLAMPRVARSMIEVAKMRSLTLDPHAAIPTPTEAWWMITEGNANALGWFDSGRLAVGARADILALRVPFAMDDPDLIGRLIHGWDDQWAAVRPNPSP